MMQVNHVKKLICDIMHDDTKLTSLVLHLLKSSLIQYQEVAEQAVSVLRQNWPKVQRL